MFVQLTSRCDFATDSDDIGDDASDPNKEKEFSLPSIGYGVWADRKVEKKIDIRISILFQ